MATITENIEALKQAKTAIKQAIIDKGQSLDGVPFTEYAPKITAIQGGEGNNEIVKAILERTVTEITADDITTLGITKAGEATFYACKALTKFVSTKEQNLPIYGNVFNTCTNLTEAYVGSIPDGSSVFSGCTKLKKVVIYSNSKLSGYGVFYNCKGLEVIDFSALTAIPDVNASNTFTNVPSTCKIIIPKSISVEDWTSSTNWSNWATKLVFEQASE